jgi:uncharacterized membrane protein
MSDPARPAEGLARKRARIDPLDWLRGIVMVLMTIDHASDWFNAGRVMTDSAWMWTPGTSLPPSQFLIRWITHLCAPTFVFLAGASIALSSARRAAAGASQASIDRALALRGLMIFLLDPLWMSWGLMGLGDAILFQVLYGIGGSMICMVVLRRLPAGWLFALALGFGLSSELWVYLASLARSGAPHVLGVLALTGGKLQIALGPFRELIVGYPLFPWLAVMALGHAAGCWMHRAPARVERSLWLWGAGALVGFVLVRGVNGYGNMGLARDDLSLVQWLHVSKYPPSLTYLLLELGLMAWLLAALFNLARRHGQHAERALAPLAVLGRTAMFFYLLHVHLLWALAAALGVVRQRGIPSTLLAAAAVLALLYVPCRRYGRYKGAHPDGLARFI